ncbi:hypothetical protein [Maribacter ulvicola]|uniref:DUF4625 domain-containing protein n=1 Tax=Maribacter ulvicola TaxID=228959 RepID=A0A1N6Y0F6_9FLAO|nr:hypothetical protein [Maribacter ulvicola]SIR08048.1 hypothetical protein SAMN05421797_10622 [Maribacter ulvicola]
MNKIKLLGLSLLTLLQILFTSCSKDDEEPTKLGATVEITVEYNGNLQANYPVRMFTVQTGPSTAFFTAFHAAKTVATNENGVAIFKLQDVINLNTVDNQTTLYFAVFSEEGDAYKAITVERGDVKTATINIE